MKYTYENIIGDAGEHLVAAKIIKLFGFPCRLISIDLGIDAEIEIINENAKSTGEFLKCQIKTTQTNNNFVYIQERHLIYWNSINIPVIVFLVHLRYQRYFSRSLQRYRSSGKLAYYTISGKLYYKLSSCKGLPS